ncbi:MAG: hypothetical protein QM770_00530 [Tepidisphaeraceae bacterium]
MTVALLASLWLVFLLVPPQPKNLWMPRYPGFVWPFFAIGVAALLMRLPTKPLRWSAIAFLVIANLTNFVARTWGPSEPPTDRIVADANAGRAANGPKVYYNRAQAPA